MTRYFYKYQSPQSSRSLRDAFLELESDVERSISSLFGEDK